MKPPRFSLTHMTCCTVLVSGLWGSFIIHYIASLHEPGISTIGLKETISVALLGPAWAEPLYQKGGVSLEMELNGLLSIVTLPPLTESQTSFVFRV